jgi:hypothetical protein
MTKEIRKPDLSRVDDRGIPTDFLLSMDIFNRLLSQKRLSHILCKSPIHKIFIIGREKLKSK